MTFQQVELSKKVAAELPAAWTAESYKVDSDSGAKYYITLMSKGGELTLALCTCPDAQFKLPLVAIGAYQCKHAKELLATPTTAIQDEEPLPEPRIQNEPICEHGFIGARAVCDGSGQQPEQEVDND